MDPSEELAYRVFSRLLPENNSLEFVDKQHDGQSDFNIYNQFKDKVGIIEVTTATTESHISALQRLLRNPIKCECLKQGWLLLATSENGFDRKWLEKKGCDHLAVLEAHGIEEFSSSSTHYFSTVQVSETVGELLDKGFYEGGPGSKQGHITTLLSVSEEPYVFSQKSVEDEVLKLLNLSDNKQKLSLDQENLEYERHLFVKVDRSGKPQVWESICDLDIPSTTMDLAGLATHVWAVIETTSNIIVWRYDQAGWEKIMLPITDNS